MENRVKIRRSTVAGSAKPEPDAQDLLHGELMVTEANKGLWYRDALGNNILMGGQRFLQDIQQVADDRYLALSANLSDLMSPSAARTNLGLGTAATKDTGTGSGDIPLLGSGGKLSENVIPALALTEVFVVADITARDALPIGPDEGEVQTGDVAVVTNADSDPEVLGGSASYIYNGSGWTRLKSPAKAHAELLAIMGSSDGYHLSEQAASDVEDFHIDFASLPALISASHTHDNKTVLDAISSNRANEWDIGFGHTLETNNPHEVTKAQVGLGSVQNYGLATESEAKAGTVNTKYMTPLRVAQAIQDLVPEAEKTDLSIGAWTSTSMEVVSSTGSNVILPAATPGQAGLLAGDSGDTPQYIGGLKVFTEIAKFEEGGDFSGKPITNAIIDCGTI